MSKCCRWTGSRGLWVAAWLAGLALALAGTIALVAAAPVLAQRPAALTQCSDEVDNDGDGATDYPADPGCVSALDDDEIDPLPPAPQCSDAMDNDADGRVDYGSDPGCESPSDGSEVDPPAAAAATQPPKVLSPFPVVRLAGKILRRGVRVRLLTVQAPSGSKIAIACHGPHASCPYAMTNRLSTGTVIRVRPFERRLTGGTVLRIYITKKGFVGKYTRFEIRNRRAPKRTDECARRAGARMPCP